MQVFMMLLNIACNMQNMQNNMHDMQNMQTSFPICRIYTAHFADEVGRSPGPRKIEQRVNVWKGIHWRQADGVEATVVAADAPHPTGLPREHYRRSVARHRVLNPTAFARWVPSHED
jgi:hypothetical protein